MITSYAAYVKVDTKKGTSAKNLRTRSANSNDDKDKQIGNVKRGRKGISEPKIKTKKAKVTKENR